MEYSNLPGQTFYRKTLKYAQRLCTRIGADKSSTLKIQLHTMILDTSFNSIKTVLSNLYQCFVESARKCYHYTKCLAKKKYSRVRLLISKSGTKSSRSSSRCLTVAYRDGGRSYRTGSQHDARQAKEDNIIAVSVCGDEGSSQVVSRVHVAHILGYLRLR